MPSVSSQDFLSPNGKRQREVGEKVNRKRAKLEVYEIKGVKPSTPSQERRKLEKKYSLSDMQVFDFDGSPDEKSKKKKDKYRDDADPSWLYSEKKPVKPKKTYGGYNANKKGGKKTMNEWENPSVDRLLEIQLTDVLHSSDESSISNIKEFKKKTAPKSKAAPRKGGASRKSKSRKSDTEDDSYDASQESSDNMKAKKSTPGRKQIRKKVEDERNSLENSQESESSSLPKHKRGRSKKVSSVSGDSDCDPNVKRKREKSRGNGARKSRQSRKNAVDKEDSNLEEEENERHNSKRKAKGKQSFKAKKPTKKSSRRHEEVEDTTSSSEHEDEQTKVGDAGEIISETNNKRYAEKVKRDPVSKSKNHQPKLKEAPEKSSTEMDENEHDQDDESECPEDVLVDEEPAKQMENKFDDIVKKSGKSRKMKDTCEESNSNIQEEDDNLPDWDRQQESPQKVQSKHKSQKDDDESNVDSEDDEQPAPSMTTVKDTVNDDHMSQNSTLASVEASQDLTTKFLEDTPAADKRTKRLAQNLQQVFENIDAENNKKPVS